MKALLIPIVACAALGGCAVYGDPYGYNNGYGAYPAVSGSVYYSNSPGYNNGRGGYYGGAQGGQYRDRDHDGVPNRVDRDRDGDGVPDARRRR